MGAKHGFLTAHRCLDRTLIEHVTPHDRPAADGST
jgi:hypothetical protein